MPPSKRSTQPDQKVLDTGLSRGAGLAEDKPFPRIVRPPVFHCVSDAIRRTMRSNRGKDTMPERALRSIAHSMGYRYRKHVKGLPGTPDIVFTARRRAVWLHGCFWHSHPNCRFAAVPRTRAEYWVPKLEQNRARDAQHAARMRDMGWETLVVWECELQDPVQVAESLKRFLGPPRYMRRRRR